MPRCHSCSIEYSEDRGACLVYEGDDYNFCPSCSESEIVQTRDGILAPRSAVYIAFDGTSIRENHRPIYLNQGSFEEETRECSICANDFYTELISIYDTDETVCRYCADSHRYYGDDGLWYLNAEAFRAAEPERRIGAVAVAEASDSDRAGWEGYPSFTGEPCVRYLASPLVGIEFEHAPVMNVGRGASPTLYRQIERILADSGRPGRIAAHSDGSIEQRDGYEAREIVTMPASGSELDFVINAFYRPFADKLFAPGPENPKCGFHMHVGSRYIYAARSARKEQIPADVIKASKDMLLTMMHICREFISSSRRANRFCMTPPAVRAKDTRRDVNGTLRSIFSTGDYPSVAVRTIGTIEFRLWPSSNSILFTKARAELSQKMVDYFDRCLLSHDNKFSLDADMAERLLKISELCRGGERRQLVERLISVFGISEKSAKDLQRMHEKFNPFTYKKTLFKFTDIQIRSMVDEDTTNSSEYLTIEDLASRESVGDTLISGIDKSGSRQHYISFGEGLKCYGNSGEDVHTPAQRDAIAEMAREEA